MNPEEKAPGAPKNDVIIERTHRVVSRVWAFAAISIVLILTVGFIAIKIIGGRPKRQKQTGCRTICPVPGQFRYP